MDLFKENLLRAQAAYDKKDFNTAVAHLNAARKVIKQMIELDGKNSQKNSQKT